VALCRDEGLVTDHTGDTRRKSSNVTTKKITKKAAKRTVKKTTAKPAKKTTRKAAPRLRIGFARSTICNTIAEEIVAGTPLPADADDLTRKGVLRAVRTSVDGLFGLRHPMMYGDVAEVFYVDDLVQAAADAMRIADLLMALAVR
jgi:hypothetical protein